MTLDPERPREKHNSPQQEFAEAAISPDIQNLSALRLTRLEHGLQSGDRYSRTARHKEEERIGATLTQIDSVIAAAQATLEKTPESLQRFLSLAASAPHEHVRHWITSFKSDGSDSLSLAIDRASTQVALSFKESFPNAKISEELDQHVKTFVDAYWTALQDTRNLLDTIRKQGEFRELKPLFKQITADIDELAYSLTTFRVMADVTDSFEMSKNLMTVAGGMVAVVLFTGPDSNPMKVPVLIPLPKDPAGLETIHNEYYLLTLTSTMVVIDDQAAYRTSLANGLSLLQSKVEEISRRNELAPLRELAKANIVALQTACAKGEQLSLNRFSGMDPLEKNLFVLAKTAHDLFDNRLSASPISLEDQQSRKIEALESIAPYSRREILKALATLIEHRMIDRSEEGLVIRELDLRKQEFTIEVAKKFGYTYQVALNIASHSTPGEVARRADELEAVLASQGHEKVTAKLLVAGPSIFSQGRNNFEGYLIKLRETIDYIASSPNSAELPSVSKNPEKFCPQKISETRAEAVSIEARIAEEDKRLERELADLARVEREEKHAENLKRVRGFLEREYSFPESVILKISEYAEFKDILNRGDDLARTVSNMNLDPDLDQSDYRELAKMVILANPDILALSRSNFEKYADDLASTLKAIRTTEVVDRAPYYDPFRNPGVYDPSKLKETKISLYRTVYDDSLEKISGDGFSPKIVQSIVDFVVRRPGEGKGLSEAELVLGVQALLKGIQQKKILEHIRKLEQCKTMVVGEGSLALLTDSPKIYLNNLVISARELNKLS